jgi:hypothetical protein
MSDAGQSQRSLAYAQVAAVVGCLAFACAARLLNRNIGYGNGFNCDSWYFFGLQFNFRAFYDLHAYQALRFPALVPWIFLGNVLPYHLLNLLKFLVYFGVTCSAFIWFNSRLFGPRVALLTTILYCCSTSFLGVLSTDYLTGAGVMWISLLIGATVEAGGSRHVFAWSVVAGVLEGMTFFTHIPTSMFVFAIPLFLFARGGSGDSRSHVRRGAVYLSGAAVGFGLVNLVLGAYNRSLGGSFVFFGSQISIALAMVRSTVNSVDNRVAGFGWLTQEAVVFTMALAVIGSIVLLLSRGRQAVAGLPGDPARIAAVVYLATAGVLFAWEFSGRIILQTNVYAPWIHPILFAAFGGMLSTVGVIRSLSVKRLAGVSLLVAGTMLAAAAYDHSTTDDRYLLIGKTVCGLAFLLALLRLRESRWGALSLISLVGVMVFSYPTGYGAFPWAANGYSGRDLTNETMSAVKILKSLHLGEVPAFWLGLSQPEPLPVPRSYLNCSVVAGSFPSTGVGTAGLEPLFLPLTRDFIGRTRTLAVVARGKDLYTVAKPALSGLGFDSYLIGEWPIGAGSSRDSMAVIHLGP